MNDMSNPQISQVSVSVSLGSEGFAGQKFLAGRKQVSMKITWQYSLNTYTIMSQFFLSISSSFPSSRSGTQVTDSTSLLITYSRRLQECACGLC